MVSRGYGPSSFISVLASIAVALVTLLSPLNSFAVEASPSLKFEWIDEDGTIVPTNWQSQTSWSWNEQKLVLQIWFEVPNHLTPTLPVPLTKKIASPQTKAPFRLSADHVLISMQMEQPVELFRFEDNRNRFLRISTVTSKTNWMRSATCKDASPYLEEVENSGTGPFFIALNCRGRAGDDTAWIDITPSSEVTVEIEPIGKTKQKTNSVLLTMPQPGSKASDRKLAVLRFRDTNGEVSAVYNLNANPVPQQIAPILTAASESALEAPDAQTSAFKTAFKSFSANAGLHAQFVRSGEHKNGLNEMGLSSGEVALSFQAHSRRLTADLELPVRRFGMGLDAGTPADTLSWLYLGWKPSVDEGATKTLSLSYGVQSTLLDSRRKGERISTPSVSPAVQLLYDRRHSLTLAPFDVRSQIASLRGRVQFPFSSEGRYALAIEGFGARSFGKGHDGWYVTGFTLGFTGGF